MRVVLTDVEDKTRPFYTDTKNGIIVLDRDTLSIKSPKERINLIGHELGHFTKADNGVVDHQKTANYNGTKLEEKTRDIQGKETTAEISETLRNYPYLITGEEAKKIAEAVPMEDREYKVYQFVRSLDYRDIENEYMRYIMKISMHGFILNIPDEQSKYFKDGKLREEYKQRGYPEPKKFGDRLGWTIAGHNVGDKLVLIFNQEQDVKAAQDYFDNGNRTPLKAIANNETLKSDKYKTSDELGEAIVEASINYKENNENGIAPKYHVLGSFLGNNCNTWTNKIAEREEIINFKKDMYGIDIGDFGDIEDFYFEKIKLEMEDKNEKK